MLEQAVLEKINQYKNIYSELHSSLKWKADKRTLMLIAAMYVTSSKEFYLKDFLELADYIKSNTGFFSNLKSVTRYTTAASLDIQTNEPKAAFHHFLTIYEKLVENGFYRSVFTYIAAGTLLKAAPYQVDIYVSKAGAIYKGMRENHFFLTGSEDFPLAAILAQSEKHEKEIIAQIEENYQSLHQNGFSKGNDLQFLSHILTLDPNRHPVQKAEQCVRIKNLLREVNLKPVRSYYPYIGMLTFLEKPEMEIKILHNIYEYLNKEKMFRWNKDINFMVSVLFLLSHITILGEAAKTSLNISIEILLQAQQAALAASVSAATAASSSDSSSGS